MGQVFTWDEVRHGRIPTLADFTKVVEYARETVQTQQAVVGALVCGSVIRRDHTIRSDIDCFVLYDPARESEAFAWMQETTAVAKAKNVPFVCIPCDTLLAKTRLHHIGQSFYQHLEKSARAGGILKGDPLREISRGVAEQEELEGYLRVKMYNLQEAWGQVTTFSEERMASYLKKLLEAPVNIARKMLAYQTVLENDSKERVRAQYGEVMPRVLTTLFESLLEADARYTQVLHVQRRSRSEKSYRRELISILGRSEEVLAFIRANLALIEKAR